MNWGDAGKLAVMIVVAVSVTVAIYRRVKREDQELEWEENLRTAQGLDYEEEWLPPAA